MEIKKFKLGRWKYVGLGIIVLMLILFISAKLPKLTNRIKGKTDETQLVQVRVTGKEITEINKETVYLLYTQDRDGNSETFEITDNALKGNLKAPEVYDEFIKGKHYQFKVAEKEVYNSYYRSVCAAARLIGGFPPESSAE